MPAHRLSTSPRPGASALLYISEDALRLVHTVGLPVVDVLLRWMLAMPLLVSGLLKAADWQTALHLAEHEYPVAWLSPARAAALGLTVELLAGAMLLVGLGTRFAAAAVFGLTAVVHIEYVSLPEHALIASACVWYMIAGAHGLSVDRLLARGLTDTALPLAAAARKLFAACSRVLLPALLLALRAWLALLLFLWGSALSGLPELVPMARGQWSLPVLPVDHLAAVTANVLMVAAVLLACGIATRASAVLAAVLILITTHGSQAPSTEAMLIAVQLLLLAAAPGNTWSIDRLLSAVAHERFPLFSDLSAEVREALPHVVVVGAGFGGLSCANGLRHDYCRVTLIDRHNYHLFQPLLYQVATATLSPADIATPIRAMVRNWANTRVLFGEVSGVDTAAREVLLGERRIGYDYLVLATGARHSYFGRDDWAPFAPGLKRIEDATAVRSRLLLAFERAENSDDAVEREALLTFVIVGAGPTGVELAGAIAELAHHGLRGEFEHVDPALARIILVQSGPRVLPAFPETLSARTQRDLERLGVEVRTGGRVGEVDADGVSIGETRIAARTVFWAAGVAASPAALWLDAQADRAGRVRTTAELGVPGQPGVYVIGDAASVDAWNGAPMPGLAPAAKQAGAFVAARIRASLAGRQPQTTFRYQHLGSMATIGRKAAVADFGLLKLAGAPAWWAWGAIHVAFLANMRSRISVTMDWLWAYVTFRASTRLITGQVPDLGTTGKPDA